MKTLRIKPGLKSGSKGGMKPGDTGPASKRPTLPGGGWNRMPFLQ